MKSAKQQNQLQPSLLDRLTDNEPTKGRESQDKRVISMRRLRQLVLRDLAWLLNTTNLATTEELAPYPEVEHSVLNYGMTELSGRLVAGMDLGRLERLVRQAIQDFEPRILSHTVKVRSIRDSGKESHNRLMFEIEGQLWAVPTPSHLLIKTQIDLEEGGVTISDAFSSGME
ncbi:MAG: type VI secretion system lysozyme [gamma proteobacterium symbiont of Ctena orbiculata]|uniref:Type VI secretion system baseplate subunit TssE n=1 Tax=Candidatus Thiodiazotropha taylori TaxID=2792791 RepID=A0A944MB90_9GAMM|nr:type VI secretion system baseplate subunit TssE [Candidatus Thiodiazotropha taylori]PUB89898.1 MAG: type VI secretion system baseplate subunit TssE [gamma proteobacterium symbiont of Ctena orbiculata]MBT2990704.1 type VI secretion system baseplate subunit TssE [Candidatus Thiodiazotropha taylori]MBT2996668.1 type VI secretion system baseplate subunit TssE [Candidatus Thiodiazotropha taylori]MBT3000708.1 type VI secretion system baseplate subunit TssE [Candidatus Thiodiazotropha taylori]